MSTPLEHSDSTPLRVRRGRVDSVDLYEVKDSELDILERGSPAEIQLNFAIFLLSLAFGSLTTLLTATFNNNVVQTAYIVVTVVGILMGIYLLIISLRTRKSISEIVTIIRSRIPKDPSPLVLEDSPKTRVDKKTDEPVG